MDRLEKRTPALPRQLTERVARPGGRPEEWFLGSLQARVLQALAARGPSTVREILDVLPDPSELAYTTVMTVLVKLHAKGVVGRKRQGVGFVYEARYTPEELRDRMAKYLVDELARDFGDAALVHFASALDRVDRRRLARLRRP